jgi:hypothetical protein
MEIDEEIYNPKYFIEFRVSNGKRRAPVSKGDGIIIIERLVVVMHHTLLTPFLMCEKKG